MRILARWKRPVVLWGSTRRPAFGGIEDRNREWAFAQLVHANAGGRGELVVRELSMPALQSPGWWT